jgi:hypothetical protein
MLMSRPLLLSLLGGLACQAASSQPSSPERADDPLRFLNLYCEHYEDCRAQFRTIARSRAGQLPGFQLWRCPDTGVLEECGEPDDELDDGELTIDFAFVPAPEPTGRLLILSSGVHGIEGYTGSALQALFLSTLLQPTLASGTSVLLLHGMNPYGFRYWSRFTVDRVDLNRNWFASEEFPTTLDDSLYDGFLSVFNPDGPASFGDLDFFWFAVRHLVPSLGSIQSGALTRAAGQGQYRYPDGLEFGGQAFQPQKAIFLSQVGPFLDAFDQVLHLDLHTGLGHRRMQLLPNPPVDALQGELRHQIFEADGKTIETTGGAGFYSSYGDFSDFVCEMAYQHGASECTNMLLEYGTLIEDYWREWPYSVGVLKENIEEAYTLYLSVRENQLHRPGAPTTEDAGAIDSAVHDLFYPHDQDWRVMVMAESLTYWPKFIARFAAR